ncbi:hypothetical protein TRFO_34835 [Tritrichomonas foetus]|uniref:Uncharacterized protein n=1 Tax=Tritrichomonas foetus TaxID=1144522 RepID=A0A1J4JHQ3_9EUKA|nr:hypothetical protein TRFO_34835 [Tritrichomonas foetus]|eukprot:OHS98688.1 hypothetical protein TRFO_34835 [Tritrichomonas foetus]
MFQNLHQAIRKNEIVIKCQIGYLKSTSNTSNEKIHFEEGSVAINGFFMKIVLLKNLKGTIFLPSYTIVKKFLYLEFLFKFREAGGYDFMIKLNDKSMTQFNEIFTYLNDANMKLINPIPSFDNKLCLFYLYDSQYHLDIKKIYKLGIEKDVLNIIPQYQNNKSDNFTMDQLSFKNDHFMFDMFPTIEVNSNTIPEPIVYLQ